MLVTKEVEVNISRKNIEWYMNLGYKIPNIETYNEQPIPKGTKIKVKTKDLQKRSSIVIEWKCDCCGKLLRITYNTYTKHNHNGKYYCRPCASKLFNSGENNWCWKPNKTDEQRKIDRSSDEYRTFIKSVLKRDNYTCQCCGKSDDTMVVHHLYGYSGFPEYRTNQETSLTLCDDCHIAFHNWYTKKYGLKNKGNCTPDDFTEWSGIKNIILETYNGEIPRARWAYCVTDDELIENIALYSKEHNYDNSSIYACCNGQQGTYFDKVYMWYDDFQSVSKQELDDIITQKMLLKIHNGHKVQVVCENFGLLFNSAKYAEMYFNINRNNIYHCCKGRTKTAGEFDNQRLVWRYATDVDDISNYTLVSDVECVRQYQNRQTSIMACL